MSCSEVPAWFAGTRADVEASVALEHAEELRKTLEDFPEA
jgi:hypothetical protein